MRVRVDVKHLAIHEFPKTPWPVSFGMRQAIMKTFNYCRQYPDKMESFKAILTFAIKRVEEWEMAASKVEFEGGSQLKPLQSKMDHRPAQTINPKTGQIPPQVTVVTQTTQDIVQNHEVPKLSQGTEAPLAQTMLNPAHAVPRQVAKPAMKTPPQVSTFNVPSPTTVEVPAGQETLEQRLARLSTQQ